MAAMVARVTSFLKVRWSSSLFIPCSYMY
jgi:hypothetical protein